MSATFDEATNLAFFTSQLENVDQVVHKPLAGVTWGRDIKLRTGISMADEYTSYLMSNFGGTGTTSVNGIPWITQDTNTFPNVSITAEKVRTPIRLAGQMITYTSLELEKAQKLGVNLEADKINAMAMRYQMGIDKMVYVGDKSLDTTEHKCRGLLNSDRVKVTNTAASKHFNAMTPDEIIKEINGLIEMVWEQTAFQLMPTNIILPSSVYAQLATTKLTSDGEKTILTFLKENCLATAERGTPPSFVPCHWANTAGADNHGRIMAYTNDINRVRFAMVPMRREKTYIDQGIRYNAPYIWALGEVEFVYPECAAYLDKVTGE